MIVKLPAPYHSNSAIFYIPDNQGNIAQPFLQNFAEWQWLYVM